jgi:hypothetical protein
MIISNSVLALCHHLATFLAIYDALLLATPKKEKKLGV